MEDKFLAASQEYVQRRHETALRLLAECDKQTSAADFAQENEMRDKALLAIVKREYSEAAELTQALAARQEEQQHLLRRTQQLRLECDRLCSARATLEQRQQLLQDAPLAIEDPYIGGVGAYLQKRHETALRLLAAMDNKITNMGNDHKDLPQMQAKRDRLSIEVDTLLKALQVHEEREELLVSADEVLGEGAPGTAAYYRRVLAYLEARSAIVLKLIASIDQQMPSQTADGGKAHLEKQRSQLAIELDQINAKISAQKKAEVELKKCGLDNDASDPYHIKVTTYLENRSEVALQLIAFLDQQLANIDSPEEREKLTARREQLVRQADETLAQITEQDKGQDLMESLGAAKTAKKGYT